MDTRPMKANHIKGPFAVAKWISLSFSSVGERGPPSTAKTLHLRLITIAVSHFCEKARWALDAVEADPSSPIYYTEDAHASAFHAFHSVPASSDRTSVTPMIVYPGKDAKIIFKSNEIIRELRPDLYPPEIDVEVTKLEQELGERLGAALRCHAYNLLLQPQYHAACVTTLSPECVPRVEAFLLDKMLPHGIALAMRKSLKINQETAEWSEQEMVKVFEEMSERLEKLPANAYLCDTPTKSYGFTAADLTLAALASRYIRPPEMAYFEVSKGITPPGILSIGDKLRGTAAGQHVLRMYREHRPLVDGVVAPKTVNQNRWPISTKLGLGTLGVAFVAATLSFLI